MRHRYSRRKLNRTGSHRRAMLFNMASSLILHTYIKTTLSKAKELRIVLEPLITLAKIDNVANRRLAFRKIHDHKIIAELFNKWGLIFKNCTGGYIRILKYGFRSGDNAPMAYVTFTKKSV